MKKYTKIIIAAFAALNIIITFGGCGEEAATVNEKAATVDEAVTESSKMNALEPTTEISTTVGSSETQENATEETKSGNTSKKNNNNSNNQTGGAQGSSSGSSGTVSVTGVNLSTQSLSVRVGGSGSFSVSMSPSNATDTSYTVTTSNGNATVSCSGGTVTVYGQTAGDCLLEVTSGNGKTATCNVTVYNQSNNSGSSGSNGKKSQNNSSNSRSSNNTNKNVITDNTLLTQSQLHTDQVNQRIVDGINRYFINKGMPYDSSINKNNRGWFISGTNYYLGDNYYSINKIISEETDGFEHEIWGLFDSNPDLDRSTMYKRAFRCYYEKQSNGEYYWYFCHN